MNKKILIFVTVTVVLLGTAGFFHQNILDFIQGNSSTSSELAS